MSDLIKLTITKGGVVRKANSAKEEVRADPLGEPVILGISPKSALSRDARCIIELYAPRNANAYVLGRDRTNRGLHYPVQYYKVMVSATKTGRTHFNTNTISDFEGHPQNTD